MPTFVPVDLGVIVVAGDDIDIPITFKKNGVVFDITGLTITCSIHAVGSSTLLITGHTVDASAPDPTNGVGKLVLLGSETALFTQPNTKYPKETVEHIADCKIIEGGNTNRYGPYTFPVRRPITT